MEFYNTPKAVESWCNSHKLCKGCNLDCRFPLRSYDTKGYQEALKELCVKVGKHIIASNEA